MNNDTINVVHIGTEISNSSAPLRIHKAVKSVGVNSKIVTLKTSVNCDDVFIVNRTLCNKLINKIISRKEIKTLNKYRDRQSLPFSFGQMGIALVNNPIIKNADIINLHWINGQFLSYKEINRIMNLGKPVIWTFHDSWPMTGGCHVRYGCDRFKDECGNCPELHSTCQNDITKKIINKKKRWYVCDNLTIVCPSKWMKNNVLRSSVFGKYRAIQIGNPIDTQIFRVDSKLTDNKLRVLFGASGALDLEYKGYIYFVQALNLIKHINPEITDRLVVQIFGTDRTEMEGLEEFNTEPLGIITTEQDMARVFLQANLYVFPSIDDNLPGTVIESLACETPVVAFETGGVPELIQHKKSGYIAQYKDYEDLAKGILWVLGNNLNNCLGIEGRQFIVDNFSEKNIGQKYRKLYQQVIGNEERNYE